MTAIPALGTYETNIKFSYHVQHLAYRLPRMKVFHLGCRKQQENFTCVKHPGVKSHAFVGRFLTRLKSNDTSLLPWGHSPRNATKASILDRCLQWLVLFVAEQRARRRFRRAPSLQGRYTKGEGPQTGCRAAPRCPCLARKPANSWLMVVVTNSWSVVVVSHSQNYHLS